MLLCVHDPVVPSLTSLRFLCKRFERGSSGETDACVLVYSVRFKKCSIDILRSFISISVILLLSIRAGLHIRKHTSFDANNTFSNFLSV